MKKKAQKNERGAVILFLVITIAILSVYLASLIPQPKYYDSEKREATVQELNNLAFSYWAYHLQNKAWPTHGSSLTSSDFFSTWTQMGLQGDTSGTGGAIQDQWGGGDPTFIEESGSAPSPDSYRKIWSVGPDFTDDSAADDDIVRTISNDIVARARTRRQLDVIQAACRFEGVDLTDGDWAGSANRRGDAILGPEFDTDGWGNNFGVALDLTGDEVVCGGYIYSWGPNETDDDGGGDDIPW